jgi:hypothetical protein
MDVRNNLQLCAVVMLQVLREFAGLHHQLTEVAGVKVWLCPCLCFNGVDLGWIKLSCCREVRA